MLPITSAIDWLVWRNAANNCRWQLWIIEDENAANVKLCKSGNTVRIPHKANPQIE